MVRIFIWLNFHQIIQKLPFMYKWLPFQLYLKERFNFHYKLFNELFLSWLKNKHEVFPRNQKKLQHKNKIEGKKSGFQFHVLLLIFEQKWTKAFGTKWLCSAENDIAPLCSFQIKQILNNKNQHWFMLRWFICKHLFVSRLFIREFIYVDIMSWGLLNFSICFKFSIKIMIITHKEKNVCQSSNTFYFLVEAFCFIGESTTTRLSLETYRALTKFKLMDQTNWIFIQRCLQQ